MCDGQDARGESITRIGGLGCEGGVSGSIGCPPLRVRAGHENRSLNRRGKRSAVEDVSQVNG